MTPAPQSSKTATPVVTTHFRRFFPFLAISLIRTQATAPMFQELQHSGICGSFTTETEERVATKRGELRDSTSSPGGSFSGYADIAANTTEEAPDEAEKEPLWLIFVNTLP
jgi:hypothetical protein